MKNTYIHIGLNKTATTWLQNLVFNSLENINFIGKTNESYPEWLIDWHYFDDYMFKKKIKDIKNKFESLCNDKINLLSSEAFAMYGGGQFNQANRIKAIVPNAKIIMVLRDPIDLIKSFYKHNVQEGSFFLDLKDLIDCKRTPLVFYKRKAIYLPDLYFNELIETYQGLFGAKNVCILKYEELVSDPTNFFGTLGSFLNVNFDMESINNVINTKMRPSENNDYIIQKRAENVCSYISKIVPSVNEDIDIKAIKENIDEIIIDSELSDKLIKHLNGNCYDYY